LAASDVNPELDQSLTATLGLLSKHLLRPTVQAAARRHNKAVVVCHFSMLAALRAFIDFNLFWRFQISIIC
jgi:hypothetical protein